MGITPQKKGITIGFDYQFEGEHSQFYKKLGMLPLLCDYLARCLLVPSAWLRNQIKHSPIFASSYFSLEILDKLARIFKVPWQIIALRLIEDLGSWKCIILQFTRSTNDQTNNQPKREPCWYLKWQIIPSNLHEKPYIPIGSKVNGTRKFPSAKGKLAELLTECFQIGQKVPYFQKMINIESLKISTTGNLGKFFSDVVGIQDVRVYFAVKSSSQKSFLEGMPNHQQPSTILVCLPLEV